MEGTFLGIKTCYLVDGHGDKNLIFLHGWGTDHKSFDPIIREIKDRYKIYAMDLPGFGDTQEPDNIFGSKDYAAFVLDFITKLDIKDPVIIGHSNGGKIALELTQLIDIEKLILIDSTGVKLKRSISYYVKVYSYKLAKKILMIIFGKDSKQLKKYMGSKGSQDYKIASEKMKTVMKKILNEDQEKIMPGIKASTLLFWGEADTATPIKNATKMNKLIKDSGIVTVKNGGHYSFLEDRRLFIRVLDKFLEE